MLINFNSTKYNRSHYNTTKWSPERVMITQNNSYTTHDVHVCDTGALLFHKLYNDL